MIKSSTGLRNHLCVTGSMKSALDGKVFKIFHAPTVPASADAALAGAVLLATISVGGSGTGITWADVANDGVLLKNSSESWTGTVVAGGPSQPAKFFRIEDAADGGGASTSAIRIQGEIGAGLDLQIASTELTVGVEQPLDTGHLRIPAFLGG